MEYSEGRIIVTRSYWEGR